MLYAVKYIGPVGVGVTSPQLFRADNDKTYVVKLYNNRLGPKVLANEYLAVQFGLKVGLCFPQGDLIYMSEEILARTLRLKQALLMPGPHFASEYLNASQYVDRFNIHRAVNKAQMAGVMLFDHLFHNLDRTYNRKNILLRKEKDGYKLYAIDNSHLFKRGRWNTDWLHVLKEEVQVNSRRSFGLLLKHFFRPEYFGPYIEQFAALTREDLNGMVQAIPQSWLPDALERHALVDFLVYRCSMSAEVADRLRALIPNYHRTPDVDQVE